MNADAWVIGASGLLGSAVTAEAYSRGLRVMAPRLSWGVPERLDAEFGEHLASLVTRGGPWSVYWCAGAGVVGTSAAQLEGELGALRRFFERLGMLPADTLAHGAVFLASSAGGVYGGSIGAPFTELTEVRPISPYGEAKLRAEQIAIEFAERAGLRLMIGRIANLYGPGQRLTKAQGLVSQICRSMLGGPATGIYVPLDTVRDYLWADDAAAMILDGVALLRTEPIGARTKILASGSPVSIGTILAVVRAIFKRRPNVALAASPNSAFQTRDLRFRSVVWPELDRRAFVPLPVAVATIAQSIRERQGAAVSSASR